MCVYVRGVFFHCPRSPLVHILFHAPTSDSISTVIICELFFWGAPIHDDSGCMWELSTQRPLVLCERAAAWQRSTLVSGAAHHILLSSSKSHAITDLHFCCMQRITTFLLLVHISSRGKELYTYHAVLFVYFLKRRSLRSCRCLYVQVARNMKMPILQCALCYYIFNLHIDRMQ